MERTKLIMVQETTAYDGAIGIGLDCRTQVYWSLTQNIQLNLIYSCRIEIITLENVLIPLGLQNEFLLHLISQISGLGWEGRHEFIINFYFNSTFSFNFKEQ